MLRGICFTAVVRDPRPRPLGSCPRITRGCASGARTARYAATGIAAFIGAVPMNQLSRYRSSAFERQHGKCWYCDMPMHQGEIEHFAIVHGVSRKQARWLRCTAEHLVARSDGGADTMENVVAACLWCNSRRHYGRSENAPSPDAYRTRIRKLMTQQGRWHPARRASTTVRCTTPSRPSRTAPPPSRPDVCAAGRRPAPPPRSAGAARARSGPSAAH